MILEKLGYLLAAACGLLIIVLHYKIWEPGHPRLLLYLGISILGFGVFGLVR